MTKRPLTTCIEHSVHPLQMVEQLKSIHPRIEMSDTTTLAPIPS
jgi:hypothetical protein